MPGRGQALTRSRCPDCGTVFRVTSEQLRLKAGKVRCGHCHAVFNAFDHLLVGVGTAEVPASGTASPASLPEDQAISVASDWPVEFDAEQADDRATVPDTVVAAVDDDTDAVWREAAAAEVPPDEPEPALPEASAESVDVSTQAARHAGLVAARELADTAAYSRWSAGALAGDFSGGFDDGEHRSPLWPYLLVFLVLLSVLLGQLAYHFRTEVVQRFPSVLPLYSALGVAVPLPREASLVSIETSDLQADNARGLFVLNATLKNRANWDQAWPSLELTLTDINDRVVARRVIDAADYLKSDISPERFPRQTETPVRLWIEARDIGATGYRLYLFYR